MNEYDYKLSFRVRHPSLNANVICKRLGMYAKRKWTAGAQRCAPNGTVLSGKNEYTYCSFEIEQLDNIDLINLLHKTNQQLRRNKEFLVEVYNTGGELEYFVGFFFNKNSGEVFPSKILSELSELNIGLSIDMYG